MPKIYDWNASAATEIKKIYDWNGSAATQLKKGYDWNGTTSSLIYSADTQFYPGTNVMFRQINAGAYGPFYGSVSSTSNEKGQAGTIGYIPVDLSEINTLSFTGNFVVQDFGGAFVYTVVWLATPEQLNNNASTSVFFIHDGTYDLWVRRYSIASWRTYQTITESGTSWDVSDLTGLHYLCGGSHVQYGYSNASYRIDSVIGQ